jgi:predicted  nucleic acid-binding Zn-ribbon protein
MFSKGENAMFKKVVIAGLAVAVGVAVLAWISPPLFDWVCHQPKVIMNGIDDSIPPEQRIEILKDKLKALDGNKQKYVDAYAKEAVAVDKLSADVERMSDDVALQWKKIDLMKDGLETQKTAIVFPNGREYKRDQVEKQLSSDFESAKIAESALDAKKELLTARKQALATAKEQIDNLDKRRDEMSARLTKMEADLKLVRMKEEVSHLKVDGNDYAKLNSEIDEVSGKIAEKQKALDVQAQFKQGAVDPLGEAPADSKNVLKQIDDYKAARNGAPKTNLAEQK